MPHVTSYRFPFVQLRRNQNALFGDTEDDIPDKKKGNKQAEGTKQKKGAGAKTKNNSSPADGKKKGGKNKGAESKKKGGGKKK